MRESSQATDGRAAALHRRSTTDLVREVASKATLLVEKELDLARTEFQDDLAAEVAMVKGLAVAAVAAITTLNMLLVAAIFAATRYVAGEVGALVAAGLMLVIAVVAGAIGWRRYRRPLGHTRKTLTEDVRWMKEELT